MFLLPFASCLLLWWSSHWETTLTVELLNTICSNWLNETFQLQNYIILPKFIGLTIDLKCLWANFNSLMCLLILFDRNIRGLPSWCASNSNLSLICSIYTMCSLSYLGGCTSKDFKKDLVNPSRAALQLWTLIKIDRLIIVMQSTLRHAPILLLTANTFDIWIIRYQHKSRSSHCRRKSLG